MRNILIAVVVVLLPSLAQAVPHVVPKNEFAEEAREASKVSAEGRLRFKAFETAWNKNFRDSGLLVEKTVGVEKISTLKDAAAARAALEFFKTTPPTDPQMGQFYSRFFSSMSDEDLDPDTLEKLFPISALYDGTDTLVITVYSVANHLIQACRPGLLSPLLSKDECEQFKTALFKLAKTEPQNSPNLLTLLTYTSLARHALEAGLWQPNDVQYMWFSQIEAQVAKLRVTHRNLVGSTLEKKTFGRPWKEIPKADRKKIHSLRLAEFTETRQPAFELKRLLEGSPKAP